MGEPCYNPSGQPCQPRLEPGLHFAECLNGRIASLQREVEELRAFAEWYLEHYTYWLGMRKAKAALAREGGK